MDQIVDWDYVTKNVGTYVPQNLKVVVVTFSSFGKLTTIVYDGILVSRPKPDWSSVKFKKEDNPIAEKSDICICDIDQLMLAGCQCGNMKYSYIR